MGILFKVRGNEFRTPHLNGWQKLSVAIFRVTGIRTKEYKHIERVNESLWQLHCGAMQLELNKCHKNEF